MMLKSEMKASGSGSARYRLTVRFMATEKFHNYIGHSPKSDFHATIMSSFYVYIDCYKSSENGIPIKSLLSN